MNLPEKIPKYIWPLLAVALIFIIINGVQATSFVVNIFIFSVILTLLTLPTAEWLNKKGLPYAGAVAVVTIIAALCILALVLLTAYSVNVLVTDIPIYQAELNQRMAEVTSVLDKLGIQSAGTLPRSFDLNSVIPALVSMVLNLTDAIIALFFIAVLTIFMLLETPRLTERLHAQFPDKQEMLAQAGRMSRYVMDFMVVRTETNFVHGVLFGGILSLMGVHAAVLWGILTFLLGYIPYIGLIIASIPAIFFAWLQFGTWGAVAVIAIVCVLNLIVENPVFSWLASRRFEMPAILVLLSVIFWGWLLGMTGMLFAVPITLILLLFIQCSDDLRWINDVLGVGHIFSGESGGNTVPGGDAKVPDKPE